MALYGLCGKTLAHSYSKGLHNFLGNPDYELLSFTKEEFYDFFRLRPFRGVNVTIPYKKDALALCDVVAPEAKAIGSVNTVVNRDGVLYGYNTDYFGFSYLLDRIGIEPCGKKVIILGTGGTSLTAHAVLKDRGAREILTVSRTGTLNYENITAHADAELLINTTPVGMYPNNADRPAIELSDFPALSGVVDVIYNPLRTRLVYEASVRGIPAIGGLGMLSAQAVAAHELFFDKPFDDREGVIKACLDDCLARVSELILVGMPGCGKSTIGALYAEKMERPFYDADEEFTKAFGKTPAEVITSCGEKDFRAMETKVLEELTKRPGCVLATGGGAVLSPYNRFLLKQNAKVIYLERPLEELATEGRPLSGDLSRLKQLYNERAPLYREVADECLTLEEAKNALQIQSSVNKEGMLQ